MAGGTTADLLIYQDYFTSKFLERLRENTNAFNAASGGCLVLRPEQKKGYFYNESWFKQSGTISHRDTESLAVVADSPVTMGEYVYTHVPRRLGPDLHTHHSFQRLGYNQALFTSIMAANYAPKFLRDTLDTMIVSLVAGINAVQTAIGGSPSVVQDTSGAATTTITPEKLVDGKAAFGDQASDLTCMVMHSKPWFDLHKSVLSSGEKLNTLGELVVRGGDVPALGMNVIVTDNEALRIAGAPDKYRTLLLRPGAAVALEQTPPRMFANIVDNLEGGIATRVRGDTEYFLGLGGLKYVIGSGINPTNATLGAEANWAFDHASQKDGPGVLLITA